MGGLVIGSRASLRRPQCGSLRDGSFPIELSRQVSQHLVAGFFGLSKRFKGRAANPDGARFLKIRAPRCHIARLSVKAGTAAALMTDHEGKAVAARAPYFQVLDGTNDAGELHSHSTVGLSTTRGCARVNGEVGRLFQHFSFPVSRSAAGEFGHPPSKRGPSA